VWDEMQLTWKETGSNKSDRASRMNPSGVTVVALSTKEVGSESAQ